MREEKTRKIEEGKIGKGQELTLRGKITRLYEGSGLIVRCPECKRQILRNICVVHGEVNGIYDLRVKARFENERTSQILLPKEAAEDILGITLDEAKKLGEGATIERAKSALLERNFEIQGSKLGSGNILVKTIKRLT